MRTNLFLLTAALLLSAAFAVAATARAGEQDTFGVANASVPEPGILAAGQPDGTQLQLLAEEGYRTVIDLRAPEEPRGYDEADAARQNGLQYVNVPVNMAGLDQGTIDRFLAAMSKAERPVLLHCATANRVGALYYAWLVLEKGVAPQEALRRGKSAGLRNAELTAKIQQLVAERQAAARP